jgi:two-component system cell cycle response regulator DivK
LDTPVTKEQSKVKSSSILVVDDNPMNLKLVRVLLESHGLSVDIAENADEVLNIVEKVTPQLILMDIQLPGVDGIALTRMLKADPRWRGIKIVALTAYAMGSDRKKILDAGCDGYISKPIDPDSFVSVVTGYLSSEA